jgi:hypothetical protein
MFAEWDDMHVAEWNDGMVEDGKHMTNEKNLAETRCVRVLECVQVSRAVSRAPTERKIEHRHTAVRHAPAQVDDLDLGAGRACLVVGAAARAAAQTRRGLEEERVQIGGQRGALRRLRE